MEKQPFAEDTVSQMNKYNFENPLNVVILFDEDEEENSQAINLEDEVSPFPYTTENNKDLKSSSPHKVCLSSEDKTPNDITKIKNSFFFNNNGNISDGKDNYKQWCNLKNNYVDTTPSLKQYHNNIHKIDLSTNIRHKYNNLKVKETKSSSTLINEAEMLNQVAENIATIIITYAKYNKLYNMSSHRTKQYAANLKMHYLRIKYYYFNKSKVISELLLLPQEKNELFIEQFLHRTIHIAKDKCNITYQDLRTLYADLIEWTKRTKGNSTVLTHKNQNFHNAPPTHGTLPLSESNSQNTFNCTQNRFVIKNMLKDLNKINLFSSGPPGSEVTISVDPKFLTQKFNNISSQSCTRTTCQTGTPSTNHNKFTSALNRSYDKQASVFSTTNMHCDVQMSTVNPSNREQRTNILDNQVDRRTVIDRSASPQPSPTYYESIQRNIVENVSNNNILITHSKQTNLQDTSRRSISRDSGFMSPVAFNSSSEQTYDTIHHQYQQYMPNCPVSTGPDLTTLIPNNMNAVHGFCKVCKSLTVMMCVGCYKYYYCSETCQVADWYEHKFVCFK